MPVVYQTLLEVDRNLVAMQFLRPARNLSNFRFAQNHSQHTILHTIIGEDVSKRRRDENSETEILQRPNRVLPRRSTTKILADHQDTRARVPRMVENKRWILLAIARAPPIVKQKLAESGALNPLQKLLGNNLIGIDIRPMQRRNPTSVNANGFHGYLNIPRLPSFVYPRVLCG